MKDIYLSFERPILSGTSIVIAWLYRVTGFSPVRIVVAWEMFVGLLDILILLFGSRPISGVIGPMFMWYFVPLALLMFVIQIANFVKLKRFPAHYDAEVYRHARAMAELHRVDRPLIRAMALLVCLLGFVMFSMTYGTAIAWIGMFAGLYCLLYAMIFFVRACEPPLPDEGDFFALPQAAAGCSR